MNRYWQWGSINMAVAIMLGAFAAHGLKDQLSADMLDVFHTGVQYHFIHALGLLLLAVAADKLNMTKGVVWSARLLLAGIILFSGSLYVLAVTGISAIGIITPFGGVAFIAGWITLAVTAGRNSLGGKRK